MTVRIPIISGTWGKEEVVISNNDLDNKVNSIEWPVREFKSFKSKNGYSEIFGFYTNKLLPT